MIDLTPAEAESLIGAWHIVLRWTTFVPELPEPTEENPNPTVGPPYLVSDRITKTALAPVFEAAVQCTLRFEQGNGLRLRVETPDEVFLLSEGS